MKLRPLSVSEVNAYIKRNLSYDPILSNLIVEGELSNYKLHSSGHAYFSLKDSDARISCVMFHREFSSVEFEPRDGMKLQAKGYISVYERDGKYQLYVKSIEQSGLGDLHLKFEAMKKKLGEEGLFDESIKKPIPPFPGRVAVVTSPTGAAVRDVLNVMSRRAPYVDVTIFPVRVQGETCSVEAADAVERINFEGGYDTILLTRGGGSIEDLWGFNEELLARAIYASKIPVISGVGHETDFTIADFASDLRAPTPSAAAELAAVSADEIRGALNVYMKQMSRSLKSRTAVARQIVESSRPEALAYRLKAVADAKRYELDLGMQRLEQAMHRFLKEKRQSLVHTGQLLDQISPLKTLERGYAIAEDQEKNVIASICDVKIADEITLRLSDGRIDCSVVAIEEGRCGRNG